MVQTLRATVARGLAACSYYMRDMNYTLDEAIRAYRTTTEHSHLDTETEIELVNVLRTLVTYHEEHLTRATRQNGGAT